MGGTVSELKYADPTYEPTLTVQMIDPNRHSSVWGVLEGITDCTVTEGYYSDTKISGSITTIDDNYRAHAWLRILVDNVPMGTFGVESISMEQAPEGTLKKTYSLQSVLWMLDEDIIFWGFTLGRRVKYFDAIKKLVNMRGKEYVILPGAANAMSGNGKYYERTESLRSILSDLCTRAGNQLGVDGKGRLTISKYTDPARRHSDWFLDVDGSRSVVLDPGYSEDDNSGQAYNRTVGIAQKSNDDNKEITLIRDHPAPKTADIACQKTGWIRTSVHEISDLNPFTGANLEKATLPYIADDRSPGKTRDCETMWFPAHAGDMIRWHSSDIRRDKLYLLQTAESDFFTWKLKLTLKFIKDF